MQCTGKPLGSSLDIKLLLKKKLFLLLFFFFPELWAAINESWRSSSHNGRKGKKGKGGREEGRGEGERKRKKWVFQLPKAGSLRGDSQKSPFHYILMFVELNLKNRRWRLEPFCRRFGAASPQSYWPCGTDIKPWVWRAEKDSPQLWDLKTVPKRKPLKVTVKTGKRVKA